MAASTNNPSYYQSGLCQAMKQKEHRLQLYLNQRVEAYPDSNQKVIVNPGLPNLFGTTAVNDWTIRDGPSDSANVVARARGMHIGSGKSNENWMFCHSIIFTDARFTGSSLKVIGDFSDGNGEWAIVGGTGEFAFAHGVVTAKVIQQYTPSTGRTWELRIRAFSLCITVEASKMGPWGGNGGTAVDVPEPPSSLQSVTIRSGEVIDSVAFTYTDQTGQTNPVGPWGGPGGAFIATITLAPTEIIKQVTGTTAIFQGATVVSSLTLVSNVKTYGPFGKPANGTPFSTQVPDGKAIIGFHARAGAYVDALGVYYA